MKVFIFFSLFFAYQNVWTWQISFSCSPHGKKGAEIDELIVVSTDNKPKDSNEDIEVSGSIKTLALGKKIYKDLELKGQRAYSMKGPYYILPVVSGSKHIKSVSIAVNPTGEEVGVDSVETLDGKTFAMTCSEASTLACTAPIRPEKVHKDSVWVGGCDGGVWILIQQLKGKRTRLKIFYSESGEVWKDGWFKTVDGCQIKSKNDLKHELSSFDGEVVRLKRLNPKEEPSQNCLLNPEK